MAEFVLEIGIEAVPASAMVPALGQLRELLGDLLRRERIAFDNVRTLGAPRRLAVLASAMAARQAEAVIEIPGPPANRAFDAVGNPTQVAEGFARKNRLTVPELQVKPTPRGDYVFGVRREEGRPSVEVLSVALPSLFTELAFPKFMRWGEGRYRFVRPIRWILCLLGEEIVPFAVATVTSGRETFGHRTLAPGPHGVRRAVDYPEVVRRAGVLLDPAAREQII